MNQKTEHICIHGVNGGCEIICVNCTHTCKKHVYGRCVASKDTERCNCDCEEFEGTEG